VSVKTAWPLEPVVAYTNNNIHRCTYNFTLFRI
jgi:hypothetical protein